MTVLQQFPKLFLTVNHCLEIDMINDNSKPPLGILPRKLWEEKRINELQLAFRRYEDAGVDITKIIIALSRTEYLR